MASSTKKKTNPHQMGSSITDFFPSFRESAKNDVSTSDIKARKLRGLRNTGGSRKRHTVATATSSDSGDAVHTSTMDYIINSDACQPVIKEPSSRNEEKNPWTSHLQTFNDSQSNMSSHAKPKAKDRQWTGSICSEKHMIKRIPGKVSQTLCWTKSARPVDVETIDDTLPCKLLQGVKNQDHLPLKSCMKSTHKSCDQDLLLPHNKEQSGKAQTYLRTCLSKKVEKPDTQDIGSVDQLPALCVLRPGGHVPQKPHG